MDRDPARTRGAHPLPARDPFTGGPLVITELESADGGMTIRGRFEVPRFARLSPDQARYLETFLRCRGMLNSVERELGISYPTARARLDAVLKALDLHAVREEAAPAPEPPTGPAAPPEPSFEFPGRSEEPLEPIKVPTEAMTEEAAWAEPQAAETPDEPPAYETFVPEEFGVEEPVVDEAEPKPVAPAVSRDALLTLLERGEINVEELKKRLEAAR